MGFLPSKAELNNEIDETDENVDDVLASMSEEEEIKFVPKSDGIWEGAKGDSKWIPDDDKVPGKANPDGKIGEK